MSALPLVDNAPAAETIVKSTHAPPDTPEIAAIYFPGFHRDRHMDQWLGEGFTEWKLLLDAKPRFPGHRLFRPEWGPFDEADPVWMERQIDLAAAHGIRVFVFDWYWYDGVKILYRPLEEGFLKARNRAKLKYALMWANHDWRNCFPAPLDNQQTVWLPSRATPQDFERLIAHCITTHFNRSNYWRVDGGLYFSVFAAEAFVKQLGGPKQAKLLTEAARRQVEAASLGRLHLAAFTGSPTAVNDLHAAGFDSLTTYNVTASGKARLPDNPLDEYSDLIARHEAFWKEMDTGILPYAPVVTVGWDCTPRWAKDGPWPPSPSLGYPYTPVVVNNTPELFGELCRKARRRVESSKLRPAMILINAWNEWTEGSALLPEREYETRFLEEAQKAFSSEAISKPRSRVSPRGDRQGRTPGN
ncbi:MAG: glycoside hydrolase family 99-like domain-containing protein [Verrucomicrobia bacterium]|nr:glycoside hydrolase family 99-like domain-containing protein [Verrucomicrobiota bacterium]